MLCNVRYVKVVVVKISSYYHQNQTVVFKPHRERLLILYCWNIDTFLSIYCEILWFFLVLLFPLKWCSKLNKILVLSLAWTSFQKRELNSLTHKIQIKFMWRFFCNRFPLLNTLFDKMNFFFLKISAWFIKKFL